MDTPLVDRIVPGIPVGTVPDLEVFPEKMKAWVIRRERHGLPLDAFQEEELPTPKPGPNEVLVMILAAGVNYNGVWAGLGKPVSVFDVHKSDYHVAGSDAAGIVWRVGSNVKSWKPGDECVLHCNIQDEHHGMRLEDPYDFFSYDPMCSQGQKIWGYETPNGSFAQFTCVQAQQVLRKPPHLNWEEAASYGLTFFTAYRMLMEKAQLKPGETVLIWGGAGGLGTFGIQLCRMVGAEAVAVVSSDEKGAFTRELGAKGFINRSEFPHLMWKPNETEEDKANRWKDMKAFGKKFWEVIRARRSPSVVFEHVGAQTFPTSVWVAGRFGRIVIVGGTSGYDLQFDVRHLWMYQKQIIGSHFANALDCVRANELVVKRIIHPVLTKTYSYGQIPQAHDDMYNNRHYGNMACLVQAPRMGLRNTEEARQPRDIEVEGEL